MNTIGLITAPHSVRADLLKDKKEDMNAQRQLIESIGAGEVLVLDARCEFRRPKTKA